MINYQRWTRTLCKDITKSYLNWDKTFIETVHQHFQLKLQRKHHKGESHTYTSFFHLYPLCTCQSTTSRNSGSTPTFSPKPATTPPPSFATRTNPRYFTRRTGATPMPQSFHVWLRGVAERGGTGPIREAPHRLPIPCREWTL